MASPADAGPHGCFSFSTRLFGAAGQPARLCENPPTLSSWAGAGGRLLCPLS